MMNTGNSSPTSNYWLCPLYSFDCDCGNIDLAEGIQVEYAPSKLKGFLDDPTPFSWVVSIPYSLKAAEAIKAQTLLNNLGEEVQRARGLLFDLVAALRLCHAGMVTPGQLIRAELRNSRLSMYGLREIQSENVFGPIFTPISKTWPQSFRLSNYDLQRWDVPEINKLLKEIRDCRVAAKLSVLDEALGRFNSAYYGEPEDTLIDQMIAFESLYLGDDKELGYKLALRSAFFLGKDDKAKEEIFSDMKKGYNLRGKVVHGNKKVEWPEFEEIIPKTEEYLRQSIRRFLLLLSQGNSLKEIREKLLDENILTNGRLLAFEE